MLIPGWNQPGIIFFLWSENPHAETYYFFITYVRLYLIFISWKEPRFAM